MQPHPPQVSPSQVPGRLPELPVLSQAGLRLPLWAPQVLGTPTPRPAPPRRRQPSKSNQVGLLSQLCPPHAPPPAPGARGHTPWSRRPRPGSETSPRPAPAAAAAAELGAGPGGGLRPARRGAYLRGRRPAPAALGGGRWSILPARGHSRRAPAPDSRARARDRDGRRAPGHAEAGAEPRPRRAPPPPRPRPAALKATEPRSAPAPPRRLRPGPAARAKSGPFNAGAGRQRAGAAAVRVPGAGAQRGCRRPTRQPGMQRGPGTPTLGRRWCRGWASDPSGRLRSQPPGTRTRLPQGGVSSGPAVRGLPVRGAWVRSWGARPDPPPSVLPAPSASLQLFGRRASASGCGRSAGYTGPRRLAQERPAPDGGARSHPGSAEALRGAAGHPQLRAVGWVTGARAGRTEFAPGQGPCLHGGLSADDWGRVPPREDFRVK